MFRLRIVRLAAAASLAVACAAPALSSDPPVAVLNAATGAIETVDSAWSVTQYDVRHVVNLGNGAPLQVSMVTQNALPDLRPRLACSPAGYTWVAWWRDAAVDAVLYARRDPATGVFSAEFQLSAAGESSRNPVVVHDGTRPWVAYEADVAGARSITAVFGGNDPGPWPNRTVIGSSAYTGDLELSLDSANGRLWASWVDSAGQLAWTRYDYAGGTWSVPAYEGSADGRDAARARIRQQVLGS